MSACVTNTNQSCIKLISIIIAKNLVDINNNTNNFTYDMKLNTGEMLVKVGSSTNVYGVVPLKLSTIIVMSTTPTSSLSVSHVIHSLQHAIAFHLHLLLHNVLCVL